jgi:hypothetical protein
MMLTESGSFSPLASRVQSEKVCGARSPCPKRDTQHPGLQKGTPKGSLPWRTSLQGRPTACSAGMPNSWLQAGFQKLIR